jgi:hypothetical protein
MKLKRIWKEVLCSNFIYCSGICLQMLQEITYTTARLFGCRAEICTISCQHEAGVLPTDRQSLVLLGVCTKQECCPLDGKVRYYSVCMTVFFFLSQYIAICPITFNNRIWQSQTLASREYIQWYISYLGTITVDWLWLLGGSQGMG